MKLKDITKKVILPLIIIGGIGGGIGRGIYVNNYNGKLDKQIEELEVKKNYYEHKVVSAEIEFAERRNNNGLKYLPKYYIKWLLNEPKKNQKIADSYKPKIDSLRNKKISFF